MARFGSVVVWRTFTDSIIAGGENENAPRLFFHLTPLTFRADLFRTDVAAERWDFFGNQVFLTLDADHDPNNAQYFLTYQTFPDSRIQRIVNEPLIKGQSYGFANRLMPKSVLFPLLHPLMIRETNTVPPSIVVRRNGKPLGDREWKWYPESEIVLYRATAFGVIRLFRPASVFESEQFLKGGLVSFRIKARAEMAGNEFPRVGVNLDGRKIGEVTVTGAEDRFYHLDSILREGRHQFKLTFENDFYDVVTHTDRNVDISEVSVHYRSAILIKKAGTARTDAYTVDYSTSLPSLYEEFQPVLAARLPLNGIPEPPAGRITMQEDLRSSLILSPSDQLNFPILVPPHAVLKFGFGFLTAQLQKTCDCTVEITAHRALHFPANVFSARPMSPEVWTEASVDLSKYAGERIVLDFRLRPKSNEASVLSLAFISNPIVASADSKRESFHHIVFISFDALRADHLKVYGYDRATSPNIDRFANDAVVFDQALTAATWTLPSFNSSFTSLNAAYHNVKEINQFLGPSRRTLTQILKSRGYLTAAFIDTPFLFPVYKLDRGFDFYDYRISEIQKRPASSMRWLNSFSAEKQFFFVHLISPHSPWEAPPGVVRRVTGDRMPQIDVTTQQRMLSPEQQCDKLSAAQLEDLKSLYDGEILELDAIFGHYIDRMKQLGLYDDALIIFTADHGEEFQEHGALLHGRAGFQETARVPLIVKFPKDFARLNGVRIGTPVQLIDLMPTILDALKIEIPPGIQGKSLLPLLIHGSNRKFPERSLFIENSKGILGILHGRYKYIYADIPSVRQTCHPLKPEELYDLVEDPGETRDIARERPELLPFFRKERDVFLEKAALSIRAAPRQNSSTIDLDAGVREQIRALGYIQ